MTTLLSETWPDTPDNLPLWEQYGSSLNPAAFVAAGGILTATLPVSTQSYIYWHAPAGDTLPSMADGSTFSWRADMDDDGNTDSELEFAFDGIARQGGFDLSRTWYVRLYSDGSLYVDPAGSLEIFTADPASPFYRLRRSGDTIYFESAPDATGPWTEVMSEGGYTDTPADLDFNFNVTATSAGTGSAVRIGSIVYEAVDAGPAPASGTINGVLPAMTGALLGGEVAGNLAAAWDPTNARVVLTATEVLGRTAWITRHTGTSRLRAVEVRGSRRTDPPSGFVVHDLEYTPGVETTYRLELRP